MSITKSSVQLPAFRFDGAVAVVTGAAGGMGEHIAHQLASLGSRLILVDRDDHRLGELAAELSAKHPNAVIAAQVADLANSDEVAALVDSLQSEQTSIDLLVNNAGVALGGRFADLTAEEFDWVMAVNFHAPVALVRAILPLMGRGAHIVNVSSLFGLVAPEGQTAYSASKFALRGFSESLRRELLAEGIGVSTVHPGGIRTRIAESARIAARASAEEAAAGREAFAKMLRYPADRAAAEIVDGVRGRRARVIITQEARVVDIAARVIPVNHLEFVQTAQRRLRGLRRRITT